MKRLLTTFAVLVATAVAAVANTASWNAATYASSAGWTAGSTTVENTDIIVNDDISFAITSYSTKPKYYADGLRIYKSSVIKFTPKNGAKLTKIVITGTESKYTGLPQSVSTGSVSKDGSKITWTGSASSALTMTCSASDQLRITDIAFTYSGGSGDSGGSGQYTELYILGDMNNWTPKAAWKFSTTDGVNYTLKVSEMPAVSEFKIADQNYNVANWGGCTAIRPNIEYYLLWNEGNATMDAICKDATITFNTQTRGFKVSSSKTTGGMAVPSGSAQGWPANYQGVMLQGFYWDSYEDSNWANLEYQATELSKFFKLIWLPNSGKSASNPGMGYDPVYWFTNYESAFGSEKALRSLAKKLKAKGTGLIADVVVNHRSGVSNWTDFPSEKWNGITYKLDHKHICCNDEVAGASGQPTPGGNYDTGDNFDGSRDLDHTNALVQANIKAYCQFLLEDIGYAGFRWDMVKGYGGGYIKLYNEYSVPKYSVGEYYDSSFDNVKNWIEATGRTSAAFDFPFKYAVNEAFSTGDMRKLVWTANGSNQQPAGLIHNGYGRYSVTFVDNHDTYRSFDAFQGNVMAANAFMLMSPGTPCVFLPHWQQNKQAFAALIALRNSVGIHNCSRVDVLRSTADCYMAKVYGTNGDAIVKIGSAMVTPDGFNDADLKAYGTDYAVWTKVHVSGAEIPHDYPSKLFLIGNVNSNNWSTTAPVAASSSSNGVYTWNSVTIAHADGSPLGYFSLVTAKGASWDVVNASHRFGAYSDSEVINGTAGVKAYPANFNAAAAKNWALAAGKYKITVDMNSMTISAQLLSGGSTTGGETVYFIAPGYTTVSGTKLLNADGTANGSASNSLLNIEYKSGNVTFKSTGGGSSKAAAYGNVVRWYKGNNFSIQAAPGYAISRIEAAYSASSYAGPFTASSGVVNASSNPVVWTGSASQVTLTATAQMRMNYMAVSVVPSTGDETSSQSADAFYDPVTNVADLQEGGYYIIVAPSASKAMGTDFSKSTSGYLNAVPVTVAKDKSVYAADADAILEFKLEKGSNASSQSMSFTGSDGKTYYLAAPSTSTTLSRTSTKSTSNNISISQGNGVATILFVKNSRRLNYGTANGGCFQAYAASSSSKLVVYKKRTNQNHATSVNSSHIVNFTAPGNEEVDNGVALLNSDGSATASGTGKNDATLYGALFTATDGEDNVLCQLENTYAKTYYPGAYDDVVRWYKNAVFTLTPAEGYAITRVEAEYPSVTYAGPFSATSGEVTTDEDHQIIVWKGSTSSPLELTADEQIRFTSMSVTLQPASSLTVVPEQFETPEGMYVCMINDAEWQQPYAYTWTGDGSDRNAEWPGLPMTRAAEGSDTWVYAFDSETAPAFIIFNDGVVGSGQQTEDLEFVSGSTYSNTEFDGIHELYLVGDFTGNWSFLDEYRFDSEDGVSYALDVDILNKDSEFKIASKFFAPLDFGGASSPVVLDIPTWLEGGNAGNNVIGQSVKDATMHFNIDTNELRLTGTDNSLTEVEGIDADENAEPIYYNMQGIRIERPEQGVYIEVRGNKVTKHQNR